MGSVAFAQTTAATAPTGTTAVKLPASPLTAKKTIRADGMFSVWNSTTAKFTPFFAVTVTLAGPAKYRIDATPLAAVTKKPSFYFSDGVKQYEFNSVASAEGIYKVKDAPKAGQRPMSQLASMAGIELIRTPGAGPNPGATRTFTEATLEGKKTVAVTDKDPARKTTDGKELVAFTRVWVDATTGLPLRKLEGTLLDGVERPNLQLDFARWTFDTPVAPATFVWAVPEGAKEDGVLLAKGTPAPDFTAYTPGGKPVKLSDYKGKVVILDFWATWCGPCQASMPHLEKVYKQVKDKDVVVLAVCVWDDKDAYDKWLVAKKGVYSFPTLFDKAGKGANDIAKTKYLVNSIPTQYVIDKEGKVADYTIGYIASETFLEDALAKFGVTVEKAAVAAR